MMTRAQERECGRMMSSPLPRVVRAAPALAKTVYLPVTDIACCISLGQHLSFRGKHGSTEILRQCLGAPDLLKRRENGLEKSYPAC